jgi:hypothetical protein
MDIAGQFFPQDGVNLTLALQPSLTDKRRGDDLDPEMRRLAGPRAGMARVTVRVINNFKLLRIESLGEFGSDPAGYVHDACGDGKDF